MFGYESLGAFNATPAKRHYTEEGYESHLFLRKETRQRGEDTPWDYEIEIIRPDGEVRIIQTFRKEIVWNGRAMYQLLYNDITERKRMERDLKISEECYRAFVKQSSEAICLFEIENKPIDLSLPVEKQIDLFFAKAVIAECNNVFATCHGYAAPEEMIGFRIGQVFPRLAPENVEYVRRFFENHAQIDGVETKELTREGQVRYFLNSLVGYVEDNQLIRVWWAKQDVTRIKQAEEEVRRLNAELEVVNREIETFFHSVSHDLRAPLRAISGYARILEEDYGPRLDGEGRRVCGVIVENAARLGQLIDNLFAFYRLGRMELHFSPIVMGELVMNVFYTLVPEGERGRVDLRIGDLPVCVGDPSMIRRVWENLFSNAVKFSSPRERAVIEIKGKVQGDEIIYSIRDNGVGFDMRYSHKLFVVFQRLHREREFSGTGLGLSIVQMVVNRHGGRVWGEGEPGKGAIFYFSLPCRPTAEMEK